MGKYSEHSWHIFNKIKGKKATQRSNVELRVNFLAPKNFTREGKEQQPKIESLDIEYPSYYFSA